MIQRRVRISNELGLHARAAAKLVKLAVRFRCDVRLSRSGGAIESEADGKSILSIMLLAASRGTEILLSADGEDEDRALEAITALIESGFGEDR